MFESWEPEAEENLAQTSEEDVQDGIIDYPKFNWKIIGNY